MFDRPGTCLFTSESVTEGHPDKVADQISDAVLDAYLVKDPNAHVACETMVAADHVVVAGEIGTEAEVDVESVVRRTVRSIGYDREDLRFWHDGVVVENLLHRQSREIRRGVDTGGAGDQGMMFGFACDETPELMPLPIELAHRITRRLSEARRSGELAWLRPDGKSQVTVEYRDGRPSRVTAVVVSCQHEPEVERAQIEEAVRGAILPPALDGWAIDDHVQLLVNPTGSFALGGPVADSGLTGRKIIVDTYGGAAPHGGGAFSGKDPSKVDRSASYAARHVAKALVKAGLARRVLVQIAYAIGVAEPVSVSVDTAGTGVRPDAELERLVRTSFDLTPRGIIRDLDLLRPIYLPTAAFGHFGREDGAFTWEDVDEVVARLK